MSSNPSLRGYLDVGTRGLVLQILPDVIKGMINELMSLHRVDVKMAVKWVKDDVKLWPMFGIQQNDKIKNLIVRLRISKMDDSWITTTWLLEGIRKQHPALYSLMMGWPEGYAWCNRQVADIKNELDYFTPAPVKK